LQPSRRADTGLVNTSTPIQAATCPHVVNARLVGGSSSGFALDAQTGRTVYLCHILDYEDSGMMGVIEVV
jgi:FtsP/CotA-like multicopper oxidase with cupredoxin domain